MRGNRPGLTEIAHHRGARAGRTLSGRGAKPSGSYAIQYFLRAVDRLHPPAGHCPAYSLEKNCDVHETQHSTQVKQGGEDITCDIQTSALQQQNGVQRERRSGPKTRRKQ